MMAGMMRNQNQANGVTTSATRKVTRSARPMVLLGFCGVTRPTEAQTTRAWTNQRASRSPIMHPSVAETVRARRSGLDPGDAAGSADHRRAHPRPAENGPALPSRRLAAAQDHARARRGAE